MSVLIFSHEQDVDGLFSAAILKMAHPGSEVVLTNYGFEKMVALKNKVLSFVKANPTGTIIIADIGVNEESYNAVLEALQHSKELGWQNIWVDHHIWPKEIKEKMKNFCEMVIVSGEEPKKCTAELCAERFAPGNQLINKLAVIAHRTDFPDSAKFPIPPLTFLISYYLGFPHLYDSLYSIIENVSKGILWDMKMQDDIIEASRLIDESLSRSIEKLTMREFGVNNTSVRVAIAKADPFVSRSILLGKIMDDSDVALAIAYTHDGKVSIRRKDVTPEGSIRMNASEIAGEFKEGGGHEGAAGGFLYRRPDELENGDQLAVEEITNVLNSYFAKHKST